MVVLLAGDRPFCPKRRLPVEGVGRAQGFGNRRQFMHVGCTSILCAGVLLVAPAVASISRHMLPALLATTAYPWIGVHGIILICCIPTRAQALCIVALCVGIRGLGWLVANSRAAAVGVDGSGWISQHSFNRWLTVVRQQGVCWQSLVPLGVLAILRCGRA